ncbi:unnamed protein product [Rotaria sp. Silwood1]|nr:unnamed protein product [Rotaria sp. Silwood1]
MWHVEGVYALPLTTSFPSSPKEILASLQYPKITKLMIVSLLLEEIIEWLHQNDNMGFQAMARLKYVIYGDASCSADICNELFEREIGHVGISNYETTNKNRWQSNRPVKSRQSSVKFLPTKSNSNIYEAFIFTIDPFIAPDYAKNGPYSPGDLFLGESPGSGYYMIQRRKDDILVHTTGEKTNPLPIELAIQEHSIIKRAVVLGHQRSYCSALIELNIEEALKHELRSIEEHVFTAVQVGNKNAPTHSRIIPPLIKIFPINENLPITGKGNIIRKLVDQEYGSIIDQISASSNLFKEIKEEPLPRRVDIALAHDYGQSKYAAEHICWAAMHLWNESLLYLTTLYFLFRFNVPVDIYRFGQICGDSGGEMSVLPDQCQKINWILVNYGAACVVDIAIDTTAELTTPFEHVHHILNPHVISWFELLEHLKLSGLQFKVVSIKEWLRMLLANPKNPAYTLASFFEKIFAEGNQMKFAKFRMEKTSRHTTMFKCCPPIDQKLIQHYLNY